MKELQSQIHQWIKQSAPLKSGVLILVGILLAGFAIVNIVIKLKVEESPFDQLDSEEQGFIPFVAIAEVGGHAPDMPEALSSTTPILPAEATTAASDSAPIPQPEEVDTIVPVSPTPEPIYIPDRIVIPHIGLDAPVIPAGIRDIEYEDQVYEQWLAPNEFAAGWHFTSATLGIPGNTVLNGHHNIYGEVFRRLEELEIGDGIFVYSGNRIFMYQAATKLILKERWQPVEVRLENARWLQPSGDERLTLVTCWPYESNTHRLILAARPVRSYFVEEPELEQLISPEMSE
ncbi:MAG: sortase [Anaerolineales bacterium]|nr:sortase [Anaerolineales bacterium]